MRKFLLLLPAWMPAWALLPVCDPDQRRLILWSYRLMMRARLMSVIVTLLAPVATLWLVTLLGRHSDALSTEVAAWRRAVWERNCRRSRTPPVLPVPLCKNPWA